MSVQRLSGWADEITPGLEELGKSLKNIINPNYDVQQELKKRLAANPELYQQLVDNENLNPGSTAKMFGDQANVLVGGGKRPPSSKATVEQSTRDAYSSGRTTDSLVKDPTALGNATTLDITKNNQAGYRYADANATKTENEARASGIEADYKIEELKKNFPLIDVKAQADKATLENKIKEAQLQSRNIGDALDAQPQLKGIKSNSLADKFVNRPESMTPQEQAQAQMLQTNEGTKTLWSQQVQNFEHIRQLNTEAGWHNSAEKQENKQIRAQAFSIAKDLNMPGNINAIMAYMTDPNAAQKAEALATGKVKPETMMDNDLMEVAKGISQKQELKFSVAKTHAFTEISAAQKQIAAAKPEQRPALEAQINDALTTINAANGSHIIYRYKDVPLGRDEYGFYSTGPDGKEKKLSDEEFSKITFSPSMNQQNSNQSADQALNAWKQMDPAKREAELRKLDPATAQRIREGLAKKSTILGGRGYQ